MPERVKVPVPSFSKAPTPEITPLTTVEVLLPPAVRPALSTILPAPDTEPTTSVTFTLYVPPEATETALRSERVPLTVNELTVAMVSGPKRPTTEYVLAMVVAPEYVLAPLTVISPFKMLSEPPALVSGELKFVLKVELP